MLRNLDLNTQSGFYLTNYKNRYANYNIVKNQPSKEFQIIAQNVSVFGANVKQVICNPYINTLDAYTLRYMTCNKSLDKLKYSHVIVYSNWRHLQASVCKKKCVNHDEFTRKLVKGTNVEFKSWYWQLNTIKHPNF